MSSDMDEIIENEVCNRLIRLSCAKMVNSKNERGGAKLHRNLLILHLLRKARDEQRRSPPYIGMDMMDESLKFSSSVVSVHTPNTYHMMDGGGSVHEDNMDVDCCDDDDHLISDRQAAGDDRCGSHLFDLSRSSDRAEYHDGMEFRESIDFDYSSLRLTPLQYPVGDADVYSDMEMQAKANFQMYTVPIFSNDYFSNVVESGSSSLELVPPGCSYSTPVVQMTAVSSEIDNGAAAVAATTATAVDGDGDEEDDDDDDDDDRETSSSSGDDDDDDETGGGGGSSSGRRQRKRKNSAVHRLTSPCSAKKCCVEVSGLISVFSSGLNVVADQFLAGSSSTAAELHNESAQQIGPFMQLACNPLIC